MDLPDTAETGVKQERSARPSSNTVQAPHWPSPQPYFVPVKSNCSRRTSNSLVSGSASTEKEFPLIRRAYLVAISLPPMKSLHQERIQGVVANRRPSDARATMRTHLRQAG